MSASDTIIMGLMLFVGFVALLMFVVALAKQRKRSLRKIRCNHCLKAISVNNEVCPFCGGDQLVESQRLKEPNVPEPKPLALYREVPLLWMLFVQLPLIGFPFLAMMKLNEKGSGLAVILFLALLPFEIFVVRPFVIRIRWRVLHWLYKGDVEYKDPYRKRTSE